MRPRDWLKVKVLPKDRVCSLCCTMTAGKDWSSLSDVAMRTMESAHFPYCVMDDALLDCGRGPFPSFGKGTETIIASSHVWKDLLDNQRLKAGTIKSSFVQSLWSKPCTGTGFYTTEDFQGDFHYEAK